MPAAFTALSLAIQGRWLLSGDRDRDVDWGRSEGYAASTVAKTLGAKPVGHSTFRAQQPFERRWYGRKPFDFR
jgi:hypothetical protein